MLDGARIAKSPDVALDPIDVEVEAVDEGRRRVSVVMPPVGKAISGKPVENRFVVSSLPLPPGCDVGIFEREIQSMLRLEDRFGDSPTFLARLAGLLRFVGNSTLAVTFARRAAQISDSPIIAYRLGDTLLADGQRDAAVAIFEELGSKGHIDSSLRLAEIFVNTNDFDKAERAINAAVQQDELDWRARLLAGTFALAINKFDEAIAHYRVASRGKQNSSTTYLNLGIAYYLSGFAEKAIREVKKSLKINPWNRGALVFLADVGLREEKELASVEKHICRYLTIRPDDKHLVGRLADIYFKTRQITRGIDLLESAKARFPDSGVWNNLGVLWSLREPRRAPNYFNAAIECVGGIPNAHGNRSASIAVLNLAQAFLDRGEKRIAENVLVKFISSAPDKSYLADEVLWKFQVYLMRAQMLQGRVESAMQIAYKYVDDATIHLDGRVDMASFLTSYHSFISGDLDAALGYARRGYELAKSIKGDGQFRSNLATNNLAFVLSELEMLDEAKPLVSTLRTEGEFGQFAMATQGLFALKSGNIEKGKRLYESAIATAPTADQKAAIRLKMNLELGRYWLKKGDSARASKFFRKVLGEKVFKESLWNLRVPREAAQALLRGILGGK